VAPARSAATLLSEARALLSRSFAPCSRFRVAAILEDEAGVLHPGVNVESATLVMGICAERNAVFGAVARGHAPFRRIAIVAETRRPVLPCGGCRQVLMEHAPGLVVVLERADGLPEEVPLRDLLPRPFTGDDSPS
jgi:cytidine deaminase